MRSRGWLQQLEARILHTAVCQQLSGQKILSIMKLHRLRHGIVAEESGTFHEIPAASWDELVAREDLAGHVRQLIQGARPSHRPEMHDLMAPIGNQEVWAAGVTYYRSRNARMEESKSAGGGDFYDRVYHADRPELFFKATPHRVVGPGRKVAIREDAHWSVPEPELALLISPGGKITGYTIGNDMSSRDIEGENPLYLPQAKVYDRSCALGPCVLVAEEPLPASTEIKIEIRRNGDAVFSGATTLKEMKRKPEELVEYLYKASSFPSGCFLLTGTGIVPPDSFTLRNGDEISITIPAIGTLTNVVG
jgi:2-dehydro-3-deoxy-D-arabinonate dehydratase